MLVGVMSQARRNIRRAYGTSQLGTFPITPLRDSNYQTDISGWECEYEGASARLPVTLIPTGRDTFGYIGE